jgi:hypothetical protein
MKDRIRAIYLARTGAPPTESEPVSRIVPLGRTMWDEQQNEDVKFE